MTPKIELKDELDKLEAPSRRKTDDEVPAEEAAEKIKAAAKARKKAVDLAENVSLAASDAFGILDQIEAGVAPDFDRLRKGRSETRAAAVARLAQERNQIFRAAATRKDDETYQYGLRCPHCAGVGIYFLSNPIGRVLYHQDWFSALKGKGDAWHMDFIPCQQCFVDTTIYVGLPYAQVASPDPLKGSAFQIAGSYAQYIVKFAKSKKRRDREGILDAINDRVRQIGLDGGAQAQGA